MTGRVLFLQLPEAQSIGLQWRRPQPETSARWRCVLLINNLTAHYNSQFCVSFNFCFDQESARCMSISGNNIWHMFLVHNLNFLMKEKILIIICGSLQFFLHRAWLSVTLAIRYFALPIACPVATLDDLAYKCFSQPAEWPPSWQEAMTSLLGCSTCSTWQTDWQHILHHKAIEQVHDLQALWVFVLKIICQGQGRHKIS